MPRVLFAEAAESVSFDTMLATGQWPAVDLTHTVLLDESATRNASRRSGSARIVSYRNTEIVLETDSPDGGWVVLNDVWHPWWAAEVDGRGAPVLRANVIFRAVEVPAGRHTVTMTFRPLSGAMEELAQRIGYP